MAYVEMRRRGKVNKKDMIQRDISPFPAEAK